MRAYYRITGDLKRQAVERLADLRLTAAGEPARLLSGHPDSDRTRHQLGQVAVPMGSCVEPSNVRASGRGCPFRHRCFGCTHFRTDPSYLVELRAYLLQLLADKERFAAAVPGLTDWARDDAAPSDDEIEVVRRLIDSAEASIDQLDPETQSEVRAAIGHVRAARQELSATNRRVLPLISSPQPTLFPRSQTEWQTRCSRP